MKKLESRARICLLFAAILFLGLVFFIGRYVMYGSDWASFYGNQQIYTNGEINRGAIYDRNDMLLLQCTTSGLVYSDDSEIRESTVHVVGDPAGNVATGAINMWKSELIGYDIVNGTYDTTPDGKKITLTIDAEANKIAYEALGDYDGTVGVYNYETGEILCLVNKPTFDPAADESDDLDSPIYFNTFMKGTLTPGSTFKLVTAAAAIDNLSNLDSFSFTCDGSSTVPGTTEEITCPEAHGTVDFESALAKSCNGAFGELTREIGSSEMNNYVEKTGLKDSLSVSGIDTAKGSFTFPENDDVSLSWAGIGQYNDLVNPCNMMVYMGAIANGGEAVEPTLIKQSNILNIVSGSDSLGTYLSSETAAEMNDLMKNNVVQTYGESNFSGLDIYAKSGTAEVGTTNPNAWFVGYIKNEDHPYAFVVFVKNGGTGYLSAGPVAKQVLNELVAND